MRIITSIKWVAAISLALVLTIVSNIGMDCYMVSASNVSGSGRTYSDYNPYSFYDAITWIYNGEMDKYSDYLDWLLWMDKEGLEKAVAEKGKEWEAVESYDYTVFGEYPVKEIYYYLLELKSAYAAWNNNKIAEIKYAKKSIPVYSLPSTKSDYILGAGFSRGAEVYVLENMSNGWSKVLVSKPWDATDIAGRATILDAKTYLSNADNAIQPVGYVKTKQLSSEKGWKYFELSPMFADKVERQDIKMKAQWRDIKEAMAGVEDDVLYVFDNINTTTILTHPKEAAKGSLYDDSDGTGFTVGATTKDVSEIDAFSNRIEIYMYEQMFWTTIWKTRKGVRKKVKKMEGVNLFSDYQPHEATHALEEYINDIFPNICYNKKAEDIVIDGGHDCSDFSEYFVPDVYNEALLSEGISEYANSEETHYMSMLELIPELISFAVNGSMNPDDVYDYNNKFSYYVGRIRVVYEDDYEVRRDFVEDYNAGIDDKELAYNVVSEVNDFFDAAKAIVYSQHVLSYYYYAQDAGLISKPGYYLDKSRIYDITEDDLRSEITIKCDVSCDALKQYEGTYTLSEFKEIIGTLVDNGSSFNFCCNELKDNSVTVPGCEELWYFNIFFYNGEISQYPEVTVDEIFNSFPVKAYGTTHLSAFLDNYSVTFMPESYDTQYETYEELLINSEHGKKILEGN